jgi:hypothetical protein
MMALIGAGYADGSVSLTNDELSRVRELYRFTVEPPNEQPTPPIEPQRSDFPSTFAFEGAHRKWKDAIQAHAKWTDPRAFLQAGADRNAMRHAEVDGLRLLAWISRYVEPGEDPLKLLVQLTVDAGYDVDPTDVDWVDAAVDDDPPQP